MDEFTRLQRDFVTNAYLANRKRAGYNENESNALITFFWQKADEYPEYCKKCETWAKQAKMRGLYNTPVINTSKYPDLDYASRFTSIDSLYIWGLMGIFGKQYNSQMGE